MNKKIAVVDDEPDIVELISIHLVKAGFKVESFYDGSAFYDSIQEGNHPDLVVLDLMLPDVDGLDICRMIKGREATSRIPIIMLTAKGEETDKIIGLELGADDYITKPFSPKELVARVRAVLRRGSQSPDSQTINVGDMLRIDKARHEVFVKGDRISLTTTEFRVLLLLVSKPGWVFTREQILDHLWGREKAVVDRTVDVHIKHLRDKLGPAGKRILNIRGVGYKIEI